MMIALPRYVALSTLLAVGLVGCNAAPNAASEPVATTPATEAGQCSAEPAQRFVGQTLNDDLQEQARQARGAETVRVFTPDVSVGTTDLRPERLNLHVDGENRIESLRCG